MKFRRSQCHTVIVGAVSTLHLYPSQLDDPRREIAPEARLGAGFDVHGTGPPAEIGIRVTRRDVISRIHAEPGLNPAIKRVCPGGQLRPRARVQTRHGSGSWQWRPVPRTCQGARSAGPACPATGGRVPGLNPALAEPGRTPGRALADPPSRMNPTRLVVEGGCGLRAVATETSVKPSAEPTSIRPASNKAMPVRMVPSSAPVSRASALACGSATEPATATVASWVRPATSWASRRSAASAAASSFRKPSTGAQAKRLSSSARSSALPAAPPDVRGHGC